MSNSNESSCSESESESESGGSDDDRRSGSSSAGSGNVTQMVPKSDWEKEKKMRLRLSADKKSLERTVKKLKAEEANSTSKQRYGRNNVTRHDWGRTDHCNCKAVSTPMIGCPDLLKKNTARHANNGKASQ